MCESISMEVFSHAALQMLILFTIIVIGALARKLHFMNDTFDALLSKLVMTIALPGMIINSVLGNQNLPDNQDIFIMLGYASAFCIFACLLAFCIVHIFYRGTTKQAKGAYSFLIAFGNTGFMGYAVLDAIMGSDAVLYCAIYNIPINVFMYSIGLLFIANTGTQQEQLSRKSQIKSILKQLISPCLISCFIAMFLAIFHITESGYIGQTCNLLGQMTVPAAMLIIGSSLAKMPIKEMLSDIWTYVTTAIHLLIIPLLVLFIGHFLITDQIILAVLVILSAMPAPAVGTMMCVTYGGDIKAMSRGTFLTTIFSIITLPFIALLVI